MGDFNTNIVIIGAGVLGLAIARELSEQNHEVLILEKLSGFGQITSSRNSGVIHAGLYYPEKSMKAKMCVEGNKLLYEYCKKFLIPHKNTKKLIVASNENQIKILNDIKSLAEKNGVQKIKKITNNGVQKIEPLICCKEALLVDSSGIIDPISFMNSLEWQVENSKGLISYNSNVSSIRFDGKNFKLEVLDNKNNKNYIIAKNIINSAGLFATDIANIIFELKKKFIPKTYYAKGNYFSLNNDLGINHLIYPVPEEFGLGIHLTLGMDNTINFGPDVEWVDSKNDYKIDARRKSIFVNEILKYLPSLDDNLLKPSYSGIRPIMNKKDKSKRDFIINTEKDHNIPGLINLYGIESPGLTSSLSLAKYIAKNFF